jgi:hypothetical protein
MRPVTGASLCVAAWLLPAAAAPPAAGGGGPPYSNAAGCTPAPAEHDPRPADAPSLRLLAARRGSGFRAAAAVARRLPRLCAMLSLLLGRAATAASVVTVYHVNPANYSGIANMNTATALGDFYFDGRSKCAPIECADEPHAHDCYNPEVSSADLTITEVRVDIGPAASWDAGYARCNIAAGTYSCQCPQSSGSHNYGPCSGRVGVENVTRQFGKVHQHGGGGGRPPPAWECWKANLALKLGTAGPANSTWYVPHAHAPALRTHAMFAGPCGVPISVRTGLEFTYAAPVLLVTKYAPRYSTPIEGQGKYWKVLSTTKRINKTCSDAVILARVKAKNSDCFKACPQPDNATSTCFITCWYDTVIGPDGGSEHFDPFAPLEPTVLTNAEIVEAWEAPFRSDDPEQGGCPPV